MFAPGYFYEPTFCTLGLTDRVEYMIVMLFIYYY